MASRTTPGAGVVVPAVVVQVGDESLAAPGDARPHRPRSNAEDVGDLGVGEAGHVAKHDRDAVVVPQRPKSGLEVEAGGGLVDLVDAAGRLRGAVPIDRNGPPPTPTELVETGVGRHPVGPCGEGGPAVEAVEVADDEYQGLLAGVLGVGVVAGQPPTDGVQTVVVAAQQGVEGVGIAGAGGGYEGGVAPSVENGPRVPATSRDSAYAAAQLTVISPISIAACPGPRSVIHRSR